MLKIVLSLVFFLVGTWAQFDSHFIGKRAGIVHLFEWKWDDIAKECEEFLGPKGFGGVQVSPPNEYAVIEPLRPWFERYQPVSYKLDTRSGNEEQFKNMIQRCTNAGVRIYVDIVVNHMAAGSSVNGTAGSEATPSNRNYPGVPYTQQNFHQTCNIQNYNNATEVRDCELAGLPDLDQGQEAVRSKIVEFLNHLLELGVAGFRMDACKHMWPKDLEVIYNRLNKLNKNFKFPEGAKPFIYQEVIDLGMEGVKRQEYTNLGTVTEFTYSNQIGMVFRKSERDLSALAHWGLESGLLPSRESFVFVCNHDNQRGHGSGGNMILSYKDKDLYTKATAFMLAHPHGGHHPRIMSSYEFDDPSQGPPTDSQQQIISPQFDTNGQCNNGWVCEHRWLPIANMVKFRSATYGTFVRHFQNIGENQIAFCRGNRGFIGINNSNQDINQQLKVCVPDGRYCDVITGERQGKSCTGKIIKVKNGKAQIVIPASGDGVIAFHTDSKIN